jgi:nuclear transport factor 2 (NTF2) superfamily protein
METTQKTFPTPPWDMETAGKRLLLEEAAWNSRDLEQILAGYADNIEMRDGVDFVNGKSELRQLLQRKFEKQLDFMVRLDLWGALKGRMAVRLESEWHDAAGQWYRSYGVQVFQFNDEGHAEKRFASQETITIDESDRKLHHYRIP